MERKAVVLGGTGFLGMHVCRALARHGWHVLAASRRTGVDARDEEQLARCLEASSPTLLVFCAAHGGGIGYNALHPIEIYEDNLLMGLASLRVAARARIPRFVNVLGNSSYPGNLETLVEDRWWDGPLHPSVVASAMPRKAQWVQARAYALEGRLDSIHLVLPNMYGPGDHLEPERSHALMALIRKIYDARRSGHDSVEIWGSGKPVREWLYVEDAAEALALAAERFSGTEILNIGSGEGITILDLASLIARHIGWHGRFLTDPSRPDGAPRKICNPERMRQALGWRPPTDLSEGLRRTVAWFAGQAEANAAGPAPREPGRAAVRQA